MTRIAFLVHSLQAGGIERSVTRIVNGLDPQRFEPTIICLQRTGPAARWLTRDVPVVEIDKRPGTDPRAVGRLATVLQTRKIDLVQSHNWGTLIECAVARKLARTPYHVHAERGTVMGMVNPRGLRYRLRAGAMRMALRSVDRVISNAAAVAQRVEQRCGYPASQIALIPNGVPGLAPARRSQLRQVARNRLQIGEQSVLIGSVGRLVPVKGFDLALQALAAVRRRADVHFLLVGDGPEAGALRDQAVRLGLADCVHLVGRQDDVQPWLSAMDLYVNSSRSEGMSQSIVEAMAAGLPVVATDVGDNGVLIARDRWQCGRIVTPGCAKSLADAIMALVADAPQRAALGTIAQQCHARFYSEAALIGAVETLYDQIIQGSAIAAARRPTESTQRTAS